MKKKFNPKDWLKPTEEKTLVKFYNKIEPQGAWMPIRVLTGNKDKSESLKLLFIAWISSVCMVYSILFMLGKFIFQEWTEALIYLSVAFVSFIVLYFSQRDTKLNK